MKELKSILRDIGFDPRLNIVKVLEEEDQKIAIVKLVEEGPEFISRMDELQINRKTIDCSILDEEEVSKLLLEEKEESAQIPVKTFSTRTVVRLEFLKVKPIPTQEEIEGKVQKAGLVSSKDWRKAGNGFSFVLIGRNDQKGKMKAALEDLSFGEDRKVSVKESKDRKRGLTVKVIQVEPTLRLTNVPKDYDEKKLKAAIKSHLTFHVSIKEVKEGSAELSITPRIIDVIEELNGLKIGGQVVEVEGKKNETDCTEGKIKELHGVESLVAPEMKRADGQQHLAIRPGRDSLAKTLQEEEEKYESVKEKNPESVKDEEQEKKEDKPDKSQAKDDDKPFFFASTDIRYRDKKEDTTQAQAVGDAESSKQEEIKDVEISEEEGN